MTSTISRMHAVFDEAATIASAKNGDYGDAWRDEGWRGSLGKLLTKAKRMKNMLWRNDVGMTTNELPRETALDMINHLAFFVMNMDDGREWGHEEVLQFKDLKEMVDQHVGEYPVQPIEAQQWQPDNGSVLPPISPETLLAIPDSENTAVFVPVPGEEAGPFIKPEGAQPLQPSPQPRPTSKEKRRQVRDNKQN